MIEKLSYSDLEIIYDLAKEKYEDVYDGDWASVKAEISELHLLMHKILELQQYGFTPAQKIWDKPPSLKPKSSVEPSNNFAFSTAETAKKLKVTDSDLRALRNAKELKEGYHYTTGRSPRPTAIWYDLNQTCIQIHGITWTAFNSPGFDLKAHTERRTAQAFDAARRRQKT